MATEMPISSSTHYGRAHHQNPSPDAVDLPAAPPPRMPLTNPLAAPLGQTVNAVAEA
jgi:hypothetical protein